MSFKDKLICFKRGTLMDIMNFSYSRIHYDYFLAGGIKELDTRYKSQYGQDFFLDRYIFTGKEDGFFIDIGANHPINLNNSYFFEKKGWSGLAFEPQNLMNRLWTKDVRTTECLPYALGDTECEVEFTQIEDAHVMSGVSSALKEKKDKDGVQKYTVKQKRLCDILEEKEVREIDFISIDVEGYEMQVLKGIDFNKVNIKCIVIENDKHWRSLGSNRLRRWICSRGYILIARLTIDDVYVRKDFWEAKCAGIEKIISL